MPVDQAAAVGSLRTLGTAATQAAPGTVDAAVGVGSVRTLGTGALQAARGSESVRAFGGTNSWPIAVRNTIKLAGMGYNGETCSRTDNLAAFTVMVSGTVYYMAVGLVAGEVITNCYVFMTIAGSGAGIFRVAIMDASANRVAQSADLNSVMTGTGNLVKQLPISYTVAATGLHYIAIFSIMATTQPTLARGPANNGSATAWQPITGQTNGPVGNQTGQTDIPNPGTIGYAAATALNYWVAWN